MNRRAFVLGALASISVSSVAVATQDNPDDPLIPMPEPSEGELFPVSYKHVLKVPKNFRRQEVAYQTNLEAGSIVVNTKSRYLYLNLGGGRALRYGIGVGRRGFGWAGVATIGNKAAWPRWVPPKEMVARDAFAAEWAEGMPGGPTNPLGARALYLYVNGVDTLYRIHGTDQPATIGRAVSSGCVRLLNVDVIDLYNRVEVGTRVVVLHPRIKEPKVASQPFQGKALLRQRLQNQLTRRTNFNLPKRAPAQF